ncbi:hypothetical protein D9M71_798410 [compost metagenome]
MREVVKLRVWPSPAWTLMFFCQWAASTSRCGLPMRRTRVESRICAAKRVSIAASVSGWPSLSRYWPSATETSFIITARPARVSWRAWVSRVSITIRRKPWWNELRPAAL